MDLNLLTLIEGYVPVVIIFIVLIIARALGYFLKEKAPNFDNNHIPIVVLIVSMVLAVALALALPVSRLPVGAPWQDYVVLILFACISGFYAALSSGGWNEWGKTYTEIKNQAAEDQSDN